MKLVFGLTVLAFVAMTPTAKASVLCSDTISSNRHFVQPDANDLRDCSYDGEETPAQQSVFIKKIARRPVDKNKQKREITAHTYFKKMARFPREISPTFKTWSAEDLATENEMMFIRPNKFGAAVKPQDSRQDIAVK